MIAAVASLRHVQPARTAASAVRVPRHPPGASSNRRLLLFYAGVFEISHAWPGRCGQAVPLTVGDVVAADHPGLLRSRTDGDGEPSSCCPFTVSKEVQGASPGLFQAPPPAPPPRSGDGSSPRLILPRHRSDWRGRWRSSSVAVHGQPPGFAGQVRGWWSRSATAQGRAGPRGQSQSDPLLAADARRPAPWPCPLERGPGKAR